MTRCRPNQRRREGQGSSCTRPGCNNRKFSDQACLNRHLREVHTLETSYCPIVSCNRHKKGFKRKLNLILHKKRCHPDQLPSLEEEVENSPVNTTLQSARSKNGLWAKINELKEFRDEIDQEIKTLEGAARIMNEYEQ